MRFSFSGYLSLSPILPRYISVRTLRTQLVLAVCCVDACFSYLRFLCVRASHNQYTMPPALRRMSRARPNSHVHLVDLVESYLTLSITLRCSKCSSLNLSFPCTLACLHHNHHPPSLTYSIFTDYPPLVQPETFSPSVFPLSFERALHRNSTPSCLRIFLSTHLSILFPYARS